MGESYYEFLGVSKDASTAEIEQAYREQLKETHPDVSDEHDAQERTKRLIEAKEVLTDGRERDRYDRVGHEKYVAATSGNESGSPTDASTGNHATTKATGSHQNTATGAGTSTQTSSTADRQASDRRQGKTTSVGGQAGTAAWYHGRGNRESNPSSAGSAEEGSWRAWNTDGSYAVSRGEDTFKYGQIFSSDSALVMLSATFLVYPILLWGAISPNFPLLFRFLVGICAILVIAYLQSVPEVGIAVFGIWTILLPFALLAAGVSLQSITAFLAIVAVVFPLGLSVLTRIALRPVSV